MFWVVAGWGLYLCGTGAVLSCWVARRFHVKRSWLGWAMAAGFGAGVALLGQRWSQRPAEAIAAIVMIPVLVALAVVDVGERRLPNRLTAMAMLKAGVGLVYLLVVDRDALGQRWGQVLFGVALSVGLHGALMLGSGGRGMGPGDVKLAPSLAVLPAWLGWEHWIVGAFTPFLLGGVWGLMLILKGGGKGATMPFGPFMIAGWYVAVAGG